MSIFNGKTKITRAVVIRTDRTCCHARRFPGRRLPDGMPFSAFLARMENWCTGTSRNWCMGARATTSGAIRPSRFADATRRLSWNNQNILGPHVAHHNIQNEAALGPYNKVYGSGYNCVAVTVPIMIMQPGRANSTSTRISATTLT